MKSKNFKVRIEDLPVFGEFIETSFLFDKALFEAYSPVYANGFAENFRTRLDALRQTAIPDIFTGKRQLKNENRHAAEESMIQLTGHIERYCQLAAAELPFKPESLKLSELRKNLRQHDAESSQQGAKYVLQTLEPYQQLLQEKGFGADKLEEFSRLLEEIRTCNVEQNEILNERRRQVEQNMTLLNEFWLMIKDIMRTGKMIHQNDPLRKTEYTERIVRSRVRLAAGSKKKDEAPAEQAVPAVET
jgi:hypothetical protein